MTPRGDPPASDATEGQGCPVCGAAAASPFFVRKDLPVFCNVHYRTRREARRAPTGDIGLTRCSSCSTIWNARFDPAIVSYDARYHVSLDSSPAFQAYLDAVATGLARRYRLGGGLIGRASCRERV